MLRAGNKKGRAASGVEARPYSVKATGQLLEGSGPESGWPSLALGSDDHWSASHLKSGAERRDGKSQNVPSAYLRSLAAALRAQHLHSSPVTDHSSLFSLVLPDPSHDEIDEGRQ
jgi:hypothetical protein